jgi:hypothetical protein
MFRTQGASVIRDVHRDFRMKVSRTAQMGSQENNSAKKEYYYRCSAQQPNMKQYASHCNISFLHLIQETQ